MAWRECDVVSQRKEFVQLASVEGANFSELCQRFEVSRKTGYRWLKRWREEGDAGLVNQSRRPHGSPLKSSDATEQAVLKIRDEHPAWGGRKIQRCLLNSGMASPPSPSTITEILRRHNRISPEESAKRKQLGRFEREQPNDLWQVDFKGEFKLSTGAWCYPLTLLDDHSRFSLGVFSCGRQTRSTVQPLFREVFAVYGLPRAIYVDNGNPWGTKDRGYKHTKFTAWLLRHDVQVIHGRPYHPQGRGKLERFHRTLDLELLQGRQFASMHESQGEFDRWRSVYNLERPHEALEMGVPANRYRVSERRFTEHTRPYEYSDRFEVRTSNRVGQISFRSKTYRISEAFANERVGLAPSNVAGVWDVYYCRYRVASLDERLGVIRRHEPRP